MFFNQQEPLRDFETGTGFVGAKLSEILLYARAARIGQDDNNAGIERVDPLYLVSIHR